MRDCAALADPANGQVTVNPDTLEDSIATYSCNIGFDLNGDETRTCFNSSWGGEAPTCQGEEIVSRRFMAPVSQTIPITVQMFI